MAATPTAAARTLAPGTGAVAGTAGTRALAPSGAVATATPSPSLRSSLAADAVRG
jgi:hypothetical protein